MPTWHSVLRVPFPTGHLCPVHYPGPLAYSGRLVRCPGCPLLDTHLSTAMLPAGPWTPAPLQMGFVPSSPDQQQNDFLLVNLTNPRTNITLIPGSLGWDSLLPPIIHSHHAFHIHSTHSLGPADPHALIAFLPFLSLFFFSQFTLQQIFFIISECAIMGKIWGFLKFWILVTAYE